LNFLQLTQGIALYYKVLANADQNMAELQGPVWQKLPGDFAVTVEVHTRMTPVRLPVRKTWNTPSASAAIQAALPPMKADFNEDDGG